MIKSKDYNNKNITNFIVCILLNLFVLGNANAVLQINNIEPKTENWGNNVDINISGFELLSYKSLYMVPDIMNKYSIKTQVSVDWEINRPFSLKHKNNMLYLIKEYDYDSNLYELIQVDIKDRTNPQFKTIRVLDKPEKGLYYQFEIVENDAYLLTPSRSNKKDSVISVIDINTSVTKKTISLGELTPYSRILEAINSKLYVFIGSYNLDFIIIDLNTLTKKEINISSQTLDFVTDIHVANGYLYVLSNQAYDLMMFSIFDMNTYNYKNIDSVNLPGYPRNFQILNDRAYVASNNGLYIVEISSPEESIYLGGVGIQGNNYKVKIIDNKCYALNRNGLCIYEIYNNELFITGCAEINNGYNADSNFCLIEDDIIVLSSENGISSIDTNRIYNPSNLKSIDINKVRYENPAYHILINENTAFVLSEDGLFSINIYSQSMEDASFVNSKEYRMNSNMKISENYLYVSSDNLEIFDISNSKDIRKVSSIDDINADELFVYKNIVYLSEYSKALHVIDCTNIKKPFISSTLDNTFVKEFITIDESRKRLYLSSDRTLVTYDISDIAKPTLLSSLEFDSYYNSIKIQGYYAYCIDNYSLKVHRISNSYSHSSINFDLLFKDNGLQTIKKIENNTLFLLSHNGIYLIDISDPYQPLVQGFLKFKYIQDFDIVDNNYYALYSHSLITFYASIKKLVPKHLTNNNANVNLLSPLWPGNFEIKISDSESYNSNQYFTFIPTQDCTAGNCTFTWKTGNWGTCNSNCEQSRSVWCVRSDGIQLSDDNCLGLGSKPSIIQNCDGGNCTYSWKIGNWGNCNSNCQQMRTVLCKRSDGTLSSDNNCLEYKPPASQSCTGGSCTHSSNITDVNNDGKTDLGDVIFILQTLIN